MSTTEAMHRSSGIPRIARRAIACVLLLLGVVSIAIRAQTHRTFATPDEAAKALIAAAKAGNLDALVEILGPDSKDLAASSDPTTARQNRQIFVVASAERTRLENDGPNKKTLVIGNEDWAFPVPIVKVAKGWQFDTAAGKEEVIDRRIGRNELAVIDTCRAYVAAQQRYAQQGHDGKPPGLYAMTFRSDPGKENGLYWPAKRGQKLSPLGDLVGQAAQEGRAIDTAGGAQPSPFQGYYFKILTAQGPAAAGGAKQYVVNGDMSGGFALVAWPAQYDSTGVMTFIVNRDDIVYQRDLGSQTDAAVRTIASFDPDKSWQRVR
jgi:Protein of unknown function (DUF2950)